MLCSPPPYTYAAGPYILTPLTTPVAYITSLPQDRFDNRNTVWWSWAQNDARRKQYAYMTNNGGLVTLTTVYINPICVKYKDRAKSWVIFSYGPDQKPSGGEYFMLGEQAMSEMTNAALYDSTNGTMSYGDISRTGP